jgi:hypothetical protein
MLLFDPGLVVEDCADLSIGDHINAWQDGRLFHAGIITDLLPAMGLFWIRERALGERRLLDMNDLTITRVLPPLFGSQRPQEPEIQTTERRLLIPLKSSNPEDGQTGHLLAVRGISSESFA